MQSHMIQDAALHRHDWVLTTPDLYLLTGVRLVLPVKILCTCFVNGAMLPINHNCYNFPKKVKVAILKNRF